MKDKLEEAKDQLDALQDAESKAADTVNSAGGDPSPIDKELQDVKKRYEDLLARAAAREDDLHNAVDQGGKLKDIIIEIEEWIVITEEIVEFWEPVSTDPDTAKKQLDDVKVG